MRRARCSRRSWPALALGSVLAGRLLTRVQRPLLVFGVAEILIGLSALATPFALDAATGIYQRLVPALIPESLRC